MKAVASACRCVRLSVTLWMNIYPSGPHLSTSFLYCDGCADSIAMWCHKMRFLVERKQVVSTVAEMPKRTPKSKGEATKPDAPKADRHKSSYQCRVPVAFLPHLEKLAELHGGDASDEVRTAVREYLQKHGLWPKTVDEVAKSGSE